MLKKLNIIYIRMPCIYQLQLLKMNGLTQTQAPFAGVLRLLSEEILNLLSLKLKKSFFCETIWVFDDKISCGGGKKVKNPNELYRYFVRNEILKILNRKPRDISDSEFKTMILKLSASNKTNKTKPLTYWYAFSLLVDNFLPYCFSSPRNYFQMETIDDFNTRFNTSLYVLQETTKFFGIFFKFVDKDDITFKYINITTENRNPFYSMMAFDFYRKFIDKNDVMRMFETYSFPMKFTIVEITKIFKFLSSFYKIITSIFETFYLEKLFILSLCELIILLNNYINNTIEKILVFVFEEIKSDNEIDQNIYNILTLLTNVMPVEKLYSLFFTMFENNFENKTYLNSNTIKVLHIIFKTNDPDFLTKYGHEIDLIRTDTKMLHDYVISIMHDYKVFWHNKRTDKLTYISENIISGEKKQYANADKSYYESTRGIYIDLTKCFFANY